MATRVLLPREQVFSNIGIVGAGYRLFFYETGTTTKKDTYSDDGLTIPNSNPVVADSAGRFGDIWISDSSMYKCVLAPAGNDDPATNPIWTADPINLNDSSIITIDPLPTAYWGATTGTSTSYLLDIPNLLVPIELYTDKQCFFVDFHIACGATPTLNINNLGALDLKKYLLDGTKTPLEAGDIQNGRYLVVNDGIDLVISTLALIRGSSETVAGIAEVATQVEVDDATDDSKFVTPLKLKVNKGYYFHAQDEKPSGTTSGVSLSGVNIRVLNTVVTNTISGASLATNQFTLPAGTYIIDATAPCYGANANKAYLYNITDATNSLLGTSNVNAAAVGVVSFSRVLGSLTIASSKTFELRHWIQTAIANGLGNPATTGQTEIYASVFIQKIA